MKWLVWSTWLVTQLLGILFMFVLVYVYEGEPIVHFAVRQDYPIFVVTIGVWAILCLLQWLVWNIAQRRVLFSHVRQYLGMWCGWVGAVVLMVTATMSTFAIQTILGITWVGLLYQYSLRRDLQSRVLLVASYGLSISVAMGIFLQSDSLNTAFATPGLLVSVVTSSMVVAQMKPLPDDCPGSESR